jgi:serine/threonine protein kinase
MPEKFDQYYLTETLSKKYSHTTYLASPINEPEHQVVVTVFASSLFCFPFPDDSENLLQKAQNIRQFQHPRLVPILDVGVEQEQPFVVREYLPNVSLRDRLKRLSPRRLKLGNVLTIVSQVGEALVYAHERHIIHGNIKPENVLFDNNGQAVLVDFNLVGRKDVVIRDQTAEEYAFCYMAPEQFSGICDIRSDQYALGCLTYELITGRVPFAAQSLSSMLGRQRNAQPAPFSQSIADLPPSLEAAVLKTLAQDPAERFYDFSLFLEVIRAILSPPPVFPLTPSDRSRRNRIFAHPVLPTGARDVPSSMGNRTILPGPVPQPLEASGASSSTQVNAAQPVSTLPLSQLSMPEWAGIIPFPYESLTLALQPYQFASLLAEEAPMRQEPITVHEIGNKQQFSQEAYPLGDKENKIPRHPLKIQEPNSSIATKSEAMLQLEVPTAKRDVTPWTGEQQPNDLLLNNLLVQEGTGAIPVISASDSFHGYSEYVANEAALTLKMSPHIGRSWSVSVPLLHGRRKVLGLVLVLLVVLALIVYVCLPLLMATPNTHSHIANQEQVASMQTTATSTTQVFAIPTVQPSVTDTPTPQPKPAVPVTNIGPTPVTVTLTSYEAEAPQNTIADGAEVIACSGCSGGQRVGYLGMRVKDRTKINGTLQINNVSKSTTGSYGLTIYYTNGFSSSRSGYMSVNGGPAIAFDGSPTGSYSTVGTLNVVVSLNAGNNTIEFYNPQDKAPDIDKIVV